MALASSVLESGVSALVPGSGPLVTLASQALEPEKTQLRAWREQKAEQKSFVASITAWARGRDAGDADIEFGLQAAAVVLGQWGASMMQVADLNLDPQDVAAQVVSSGSQAQQGLSEQGRDVCGYAVLVFYQRLIAQNQAALDRAVQRVLLLRTGKTLEAVEALLAAQGQHAPGRAAGPVRVGEIPIEPPGFVDRAALDELARAVGEGGVGVVCAVTGLRGVGKTQLAAAYARARITDEWGLVAWVDAETETSVLGGLAEVAEALGVADPEGDSAASAQRLRDHLQGRAEPGLLVLDNALHPDRIRRLLPASGATQVVITTTDRAFTELGVTVDVDVYTPDEAVGYLQERTGHDDPQGAAALAEVLGRLPLALAQAAPVIRRRRLSYAVYQRRLAAVPVEDLLGPIAGQPYGRSTAAALLMAVEQVEQPDPDDPHDAGGPEGLVGRLLRLVAVLSTDGTSPSVLYGIADEAGHASDPDGAAWAVGEVIGRCMAASVLAWSTEETLLMHRLLARVIRDRDAVAGRSDETADAALDLLDGMLFDPEDAWQRRTEGNALAVAHRGACLWHAAPTVWASPHPDPAEPRPGRPRVGGAAVYGIRRPDSRRDHPRHHPAHRP